MNKLLTISLISSIWHLSLPSLAQIVPDATLPNNTTVIINGNRFTIDGGTTVGDNLFHSFENFSLPTGTEAFFDNSVNISNIINRVTGGNISNIDGLIRANGTANFFLLNPNGIVFGPNARLDVGGSFISSTAESLIFSDGSFYSATNANAPPLLTINRPIGLQLSTQQQGDIVVQGTGHQIQQSQFVFFPFEGAGQSQTGLRVSPGQTLALVGSDVFLDGGILTAPGGNIELAAVKQGQVSFDSSNSSFNYSGVESSGNIQLSNQAAADASGVGSSNISIQGSTLQIINDSLVVMQNQGPEPDGTLRVNVTDNILITDTTPNATSAVGLRTQTVADGKSADIVVSTQQLNLFNGGPIVSSSFSNTGSAGDIDIRVSDSVELVGFSTANPLFVSIINTSGFADAGPGNITLSARKLNMRDGGTISSNVFGQTDSGNVNINVAESIEIIGINPINLIQSQISSTTVVRQGNAGDIIINTGRLSLIDAGSINTSSLSGSGNSGNVTINARESIEIIGESLSSNSTINSSAVNFEPETAAALGLPVNPSTGDAGTVRINTPELRLLQGGEIGVNSQGTGNPGQLEINADVINLNNSQISATSQEGSEGNISITTSDLLELRNGSQITTQAGTETGGGGDGGDINLDSNNIVLLENSQITANGFEGAGGNINITTQGLFESSDSEITASSSFGVSGVVNINNPEVDPSSAVAPLPQETTDLNQLIAAGCAGSGDSSFTFIGRGGIPVAPMQTLRGQTLWQDLENYTVSEEPQFSANQIVTHGTLPKYKGQLIESTGWIFHPDGRVELVAVMPNQNWYRPINCQDL